MDELVPVERIELPTFGLQNRCSTAELNRQQNEWVEDTQSVNAQAGDRPLVRRRAVKYQS
jgi:hypothetical protein